MNKATFQEQVTADPGMIQTLLTDALNAHKEKTRIARAIYELEKKRTETTSGLLESSANINSLAFLSISIGFLRIFGLSWRSIFDGLLGLFSLDMTASGLLGYWRATRLVQTLQGSVPAMAEEGQTE